jgi:outer membrane immunogenic protein
MLNSPRAAPCAPQSRAASAAYHTSQLIGLAALLLVATAAHAAPNDAYRQTTGPAFGAPYAPPAPANDARYRPLDGSPRYATGSTGPSARNGYPSPHNLPAIWSGGYAGLNAGYGWGRTAVSAPGFGAANPSGGLGGLHAGYNWQSGNIVFGTEADLNLSWAQNTSTFAGGASINSHPTWVSSLRGRLGYAFNNTLVYGTLGLALTNTNFTLQQPGSYTQLSETQFGYVVGLGAEYKITPQASLRLEALHYGFADKNLNLGSGITPLSSSLNTVRAGMTFHFN